MKVICKPSNVKRVQKSPANGYKDIDRYLKNGVSKTIVHVIKHVNFQLYRVHPDGVFRKPGN